MRIVTAALVLGACAVVRAQSPSIEVTYKLTVSGNPIADGTLYVYQISPRDYTDRVELGRIKQGIAHIHLDSAMLAAIRGMPSRDDQYSYLLAVHANGLAWFRTRSFREPLADLLPALQQLGSFATWFDGSHPSVDLRPPVKQTLQVLGPEGVPLVGVEARLHTYINTEGRCEVRTTFEGVFPTEDDSHTGKTDANGQIQFTAPLTDLALSIENYDAETGPLGRTWLRPGYDIDLTAGLTHTIRIRRRAPDRSFTLRLVRPNGTPVSDAWLVEADLTPYCGGAGDGPAGTTDGNGDVTISIAPEHTATLWFQLATQDDVYRGRPHDTDPDWRELSQTELVELFKTGVLTVTWHR
jgi:hypothetical protein